MAFFDNLGKRITDAGQNVAQQTKNLADITQLNTSILEKQKRIHQLYQNLGQAYYAAHREDADAEEYELILQISTLLSEVTQCRDKIEQIRERSAKPAPLNPEGRLCPQCGAAVPEGDLFCTHCGNKM